jgi:hypothetical protein
MPVTKPYLKIQRSISRSKVPRPGWLQIPNGPGGWSCNSHNDRMAGRRMSCRQQTAPPLLATAKMSLRISIGPEPVLAAHAPSPSAAGSHLPARGPPGDRSALHCRWNAIATQSIGIISVQARGLKSKVGLAAAKAAALRINLNVQGCSIVAAPMHAPSRTSLLLPLLLSHNLPLPRVH